MLLPGIKKLTDHHGVDVAITDEGDSLLLYFEGVTKEFKSTIFEVWADYGDFHLLTAVLTLTCEDLKKSYMEMDN